MPAPRILQKIQCTPWLCFCAMVLFLTAKCAIWHAQFFGDKLIPVGDILWCVLFLSAGILLCRNRPWWSLLLFFTTNLWLFANFVYERAWGQILTADMVRMADNLRGFEDSLLTYWHADMLWWLLLPDALYVLSIIFLWATPSRRSWKGAFAIVGLALLLIPVRQTEYFRAIYTERKEYNNHEGIARWWHLYKPLFHPYQQAYEDAYFAFLTQTHTPWERKYIHRYGILNYGIEMVCFDRHYRKFMEEIAHCEVSFTDREKDILSSLTAKEPVFTPERNLIIILVESLESWAIDYPTPDGYVMPNLRSFIRQHHTFYAPNVYNMIHYGGSSDGQLILLTGLLPIHKGVTVALYGDQAYPNFCHFYPHSITLNPSPGTWKQQVVNPHYGIQLLEESDSIRNDEGIFHRLSHLDLPAPYCALAITVSSHIPYSIAEEVDLALPNDMPDNMARYLKSLHYMDKHLGMFLQQANSKQLLMQSDIVITGDHTIFYAADWELMKQYAHEKGIQCLGDGANACPLVLYSPTFKQPVYYAEAAYQMDIYPSILHMIGCSSPAWRGFGKDLLDDTTTRIPYHEAKELSNKMITSSYFDKKQPSH